MLARQSCYYGIVRGQHRTPSTGNPNVSLSTRFLTLATLLVLLASAAAYAVFERLAETIIERWGRQVAEIQVRYDSARLLQSLEREIALARQMAQSPILLDWAQAPRDAELERRAIVEMESFRENFRDNSYFVALVADGAYYYNNADNAYAGRQYRYHLDPAKADDAWFFKLVEEGREFHLNVNPDTQLGVTKLWIDVLMTAPSGATLGIIGTGLELASFLEDIVDIQQPGVTTLFVDYHGAIQLYRDRNYIDFATIVKPEGQKNTIDRLFDTAEDRSRIAAMLDSLRRPETRPGMVASDFVTVGGRRHLAGIAFLPNIGWFEITLLDLDTLLPIRHFLPLVLVILATLCITLLTFHSAIRFRILRPLAALEAAMVRVREGDLTPPVLPPASGEIAALNGHFIRMAAALRNHTDELENRVRERTRELHRLARLDSLTELLNRRGMSERLEEELQRARRHRSRFGLLLLDVDFFKEINDRHGHQAGDGLLQDVARVIRTCMRPYDHAARWGGDEFLVLLASSDEVCLRDFAERLRSQIGGDGAEGRPPRSISIGVCMANPDDSEAALLQRVDEALYEAKNQGRNRVWVAGTPLVDEEAR